MIASFCSRKCQSDENYIQDKIILRELNTNVVIGRYINWSEAKTIEWQIFGG